MALDKNIKPEDGNIHDTKLKILDSAEKLFALNGFENTSIRAIVKDAGVNVALVNYHFGSKEELIRAVIDRRLIPLEVEKYDRLKKLESECGKQAPEIERIMDAFISPLFSLSGNLQFLRLLARIHSELPPPSDLKNLPDELIKTNESYMKAIEKALPGQSTDEIGLKIFCVMNMIHQVIIMTQMAPFPGSRNEDLTLLQKRLITYSIAIFKAK